MGDLIDRAAKAFLEALPSDFYAEDKGSDWYIIDGDGDIRPGIIAVLRAIREPTPMMVDSADEQFDWGPPGYDSAPLGTAYAEGVWTVMIDKAIVEAGEIRDDGDG